MPEQQRVKRGGGCGGGAGTEAQGGASTQEAAAAPGEGVWRPTDERGSEIDACWRRCDQQRAKDQRLQGGHHRGAHSGARRGNGEMVDTEFDAPRDRERNAGAQTEDRTGKIVYVTIICDACLYRTSTGVAWASSTTGRYARGCSPWWSACQREKRCAQARRTWWQYAMRMATCACHRLVAASECRQ